MNNLNTKELYKIALKLAIPIMVQNLISMLFGLAIGMLIKKGESGEKDS